MKVHTISKGSSAATIAETHSTPIAAQPIATAPHSDKMAGMLLAQQVVATVKQQAGAWHTIAVGIIDSNAEVRASFLYELKKQVSAIKKDNTDGLDAKKKAKIVATATQQCSNMATIARAWNAGATIRGFVEWVQAQGGKGLTVDTWRDAGYTLMVGYARTISASAAGRKPDNLLVKFSKWLKAQEAATAEEKAIMEGLMAVQARIASKYPELLPASK